MKLKYIGIKSSVIDFIQANDLGHEEVDEALLIKWAGDVVKFCSTQEGLRHRITILQVKGSKAELPQDYEILAQAAYKEECDCEEHEDCCSRGKTRREEIVQWVHGTLEKDCQLEINLKCPRCHKTECGCESPMVEVNVDRVWEMAHPEIYYSHFSKVGRFGYGAASSYYTPKFRLMKYATNEFFKLKQLIKDCPNVNCDNCRREFIIEPPYIEVDFEEGEILLSYLGKPLDKDGEVMVPDHAQVHAAILNHLDYMWYRMKWKKTGDNKARAVSQEAMQLRDVAIGLAKAELEIPDFLEFKNYLQTGSFMRQIPTWGKDRAGKMTRDIAGEYRKLLS